MSGKRMKRGQTLPPLQQYKNLKKKSQCYYFTPHTILHIKRCRHLEQMFFHHFETINKPELLLKNFPLYYSGSAKNV